MLKFYSCCAHSVSKNNNCTHHRMKSMLETLNELFNENCNGLHSNNLHFHTPPDINVKTLNAVFTIPCTSLEFRKKGCLNTILQRNRLKRKSENMFEKRILKKQFKKRLKN